MSDLRTFIAKTESILINFNDARRGTVREATIRIAQQTFKYIHSMYTRDLFMELVKSHTPTTMIASLTEKNCKKLPIRSQTTLRNMVMRWTLEKAEEDLRKNAQRNTRIWRENIAILRHHNVHKQFQKIWERERKRYKTNLQKKKRKKVRFLKTKYRREARTHPDKVDGIMTKDQETSHQNHECMVE